jgi:excisionase family DNA binding protein
MFDSVKCSRSCETLAATLDSRGMQYLTTQQVAGFLGVTPCRVRQIAEARSIASVKVGGTRLWTAQSLSKFARRPGGRPKKKG